jgi:hypothetical protein
MEGYHAVQQVSSGLIDADLGGTLSNSVSRGREKASQRIPLNDPV